jgi:hypothetical protein
MAEPGDIYVELRFQGAESFPAQLLLGVIEATERAIARAENEDIDALQKEFPKLPTTIFDAMRYRAERLVAQTLNFERASSGSLILGGVAVALSYWLLDQTLSETVKQAWVESDLHKRIKEFLSSRLLRKAEQIAHDVRPSRWPKGGANIETLIERNEPNVKIVVLVTPGRDLLPLPTARQISDAHEQRRRSEPPDHETME